MILVVMETIIAANCWKLDDMPDKLASWKLNRCHQAWVIAGGWLERLE
jgi:hypothetical protein